jgi:multicomponent Na+:H+ antiporter subunit G
MNLIDVLSAALCLCGLIFFTAGTMGMLRFPDALSRLHALTKGDNLGLGFVVLGLMIRSTPAVALKLGLIWLVILAASSTSCFLVGNHIAQGESSSTARTPHS